jgi:hypothetical protein
MKKLIFIFVSVCVITGAVSAQSLSNGFQNPGGSLNLDLLQWGGNYDPASVAQAQGAAKAAWQNMLGGLWSWKNGDTFGGAMTAGLEGGGLALTIVGFAMFATTPADPDNMAAGMGGLAAAGVGVAVMSGGMIFGYLRGSSQYKKQNAVAQGFGGNPLEHVSFGIVPGAGGSLIYSAKF